MFPGLRSQPRASGNQPEIEREREKERHGDPSSDGTRVLLLNSVRVYVSVASLDKHQETRLYKFTKKARSNRGHKAKRQSISKEGRK